MPSWSWIRLRISLGGSDASGPPAQVAVAFPHTPSTRQSVEIFYEPGPPPPADSEQDSLVSYLQAGYRRTSTLLSWIPSTVYPQVSPVVRGPTVIMEDGEASGVRIPSVRMYSADRAIAAQEQSVDNMSIVRDETLLRLLGAPSRRSSDRQSWSASSISSASTARPGSTNLITFSDDGYQSTLGPSMRMDVDGPRTSRRSTGSRMDVDFADADASMRTPSLARLFSFSASRSRRQRRGLGRWDDDDAWTSAFLSTVSSVDSDEDEDEE